MSNSCYFAKILFITIRASSFTYNFDKKKTAQCKKSVNCFRSVLFHLMEKKNNMFCNSMESVESVKCCHFFLLNKYAFH